MSYCCFAQTESNENPAPASNEVIVVLRVSVKANFSRAFLAKTRDIYNTENSEKVAYNTEDKTYQNLVFSPNENAVFLTLKENDIAELPYVEYLFFGSNKARFLIPFDFKFKVPSGAKAVYLGSFVVTIDSNFEITDVKRVDEYDLAKKALKKAYPVSNYDLVRIGDLSIE